MKSNRIESLDLLKGLVMIIMALDHVRDYFHADAFLYDPTDIESTSLAVFFTRFITHFCATVFIFLAGTSAFFVGQRKTKGELSSWLVKRGLWLIIAEITLLKFGWLFQLNMTTLTLQVIWVLGISMVILAAFIHVPARLMIGLSVLVIFTHNFLDRYNPEGNMAIVWSFLHALRFNQIGPMNVMLVYPIIPWVFVMTLGYHFAKLYVNDYPVEQRKKFLVYTGLSMIVLFIAIRLTNLFGESDQFVMYPETGKTIMSFLHVSKYPPSLLYLLVTLGPSFLFLAFTENWRNKVSEVITLFGRVPMFYYIIHVYLIHVGATILAMSTGYHASDMVIDFFVVFEPALKGYGVTLLWVYVVWVITVAILYPICRWYDTYKKTHRQHWWLSYV